MKKKTKAITYFIIFLILIVGGYFSFRYLVPQISLPGTGCQFINNPNLNGYTEVINSNYYQCNSSECIVSGCVKMDNPVGSVSVKFRWGVSKNIQGEYNYATYDFGNGLVPLCRSATGGSSVHPSEGLRTPEGWIITKNDYKLNAIYVWIMRGGNDYLAYSQRDCSPSFPLSSADVSLSSTPLNGCLGNEVCGSSQGFSGKYNFCPSNNPTYTYCSGSANSFVGQSPQTFCFPDDIKLIRGESVNFNPKDANNQDLLNRYIQVKNYDCSCTPAIASGSACSSDQIKCKPSLTCPAGYNLYSGTDYCGSSSDSDLRYRNTNNVCRTSPTSSICKNLVTTYNTYVKCDGTQTINQATCGAFGTGSNSCPTGQSCYVDSTGATTEGVGHCKCPTSTCFIGQKKKTGDYTYDECVAIGTCMGWSSRTCLLDKGVQTVFDDVSKKCILPSGIQCSVGNSKCVSGDPSKINKCQFVSIGDASGYIYLTPESCLGVTQCNDKAGENDVCDCSTVDKCTAGDIKCLSTSSYSICKKDILDLAGSCLDYRDNIKVGETQKCEGDTIQARSDIGCEYNTPGKTCSLNLDTNNIKFETCTNNVCTATQDQYTASESDYVPIIKNKCIGSNVYKATKYTGNFGEYYRWDKSQTCSELNSGGITFGCTNGACSANSNSYSATLADYSPVIKTKCIGMDVYIATKHTGNFADYYTWEKKETCGGNDICSNGKCTPTYKNVGIIGQNQFAINQNIENITIDVLSSAADASKSIIAQLCEGSECTSSNELKRINTFFSSNGKAILDFDYSYPRSGTLTIKVTVGDPNGINYQTSKQITILKTIIIKPVCTPLQAYVGRDVTCTWDIKDIDTGSLISAIPTVTIKQGTRAITGTPVGSNGIKFTPDTVGSVEFKVSASKEGYISDTQIINIDVQELSRTQTLLLDNVDFFTYSEAGITVGTKQLELKLSESGVPINVQTISAKIITPSAQEVPITFNKVSTGDYKVIYNFQQPGQVYILKGEVIFTDLTKENLPFEYRINTASSATEDITGQFNILLWGSIIGIIFLVIGIIVIIIVKRRK